MKTQEFDRVGSELQQVELMLGRREKLTRIRKAGLFIGSVWAYGLSEGEPIFRAQTLWTPYRYDVDSGRLAVNIGEWSHVPTNGIPQPNEGTGELERGTQLLMSIFETMSAEGTIQLLAVPETPPQISDDLTVRLVQEDRQLR